MSKIQVEDYGDILALKCDGEKVYFSTKGGSYQGEYVAVIKSEKEIGYDGDKLDQYYVFIGDYGSCSGCDFIESETEYDESYTNQYMDSKVALEYAEQSTPIYILPKKPTQKWVDELAERVNS